MEREVLRNEARGDIRRMAVEAGAMASVGGPVRHALTPAQMGGLRLRQMMDRVNPSPQTASRPSHLTPVFRQIR